MKTLRKFRVPVSLFLVFFLVFALTISSRFSYDAVAANFGAWHLATFGNPWIEDRSFLEDHPLRGIWVVEAGQHEVIARSPGVILFSVPAYWVAQQSEMTHFPAGITAAFLVALAVTLMYLAFSSRLSRKLSIVAVAVFALGTPVWAVAADAMWPHTITVFGIAGMVWAASRERWWLVGLFGGIALTGRVHAAIIVAVLGLGLGIARRDPWLIAKVAIPSLSFLGLNTVWNFWIYGSWNPTGAYRIDESTEIADRYPSLLTNELGLFLAPDRGVLIWTPVLLVMLPTVVRIWKSLPDWSVWLAGAGLTYTLVQGWVNTFDGGDAFWSYRLGLELVACVAPLYAFSIPHVGRIGRRIVIPIVGLQILVIGLGSILNLPGLPREFAWTENSMLHVIAASPALGVILIFATIVIAFLAARIVGPIHQSSNN